MSEPGGRLVVVRAQAKRRFDVGDPVLAAAEKHLILTSGRIGLGVVGVFGDDRLDLVERQVPCAGVVQRVGPGETSRRARRIVRQPRLAQALDDARDWALKSASSVIDPPARTPCKVKPGRAFRSLATASFACLS